MGWFAKKPAAARIGRGYELTPTGAALREALLAGQPRQIAQLAPDCAQERDGTDRLATHIAQILGAFMQTQSGDLDPFVALTCREAPTLSPPVRPKDEPEQHLDYACARLFEAASLMMVLDLDRFHAAPEYDEMLDTFVASFKWTRTWQQAFDDVDPDVVVGMGKHCHTFEGAVPRLISGRNLRRAATS